MVYLQLICVRKRCITYDMGLYIVCGWIHECVYEYNKFLKYLLRRIANLFTQKCNPYRHHSIHIIQDLKCINYYYILNMATDYNIKLSSIHT